MSELDANLLMRHTGLLLRFYPRAYRAHRGEEIFDTLLETTRPGRGWPPAREVASVIGGGLRARRAANLSQGLPASLRHVGILAGAMIMAGYPADLLGAVSQDITRPFSPPDFPDYMVPQYYLTSVMVVAALAAAWCGRRWLVAAAVAAAFAVSAAGHPAFGGFAPVTLMFAAAPALVLLVPLTTRAKRPPAALLWVVCLPAALNVVAGLAIAAGQQINIALPVSPIHSVVLLYPYGSYLSLAQVLVAVCWLVTDVRPLAAVIVQMLLWRVVYFGFGYPNGASRPQMVIVIGVALALTAALAWLLRHRARTAPPTIG